MRHRQSLRTDRRIPAARGRRARLNLARRISIQPRASRARRHRAPESVRTDVVSTRGPERWTTARCVRSRRYRPSGDRPWSFTTRAPTANFGRDGHVDGGEGEDREAVRVASKSYSAAFCLVARARPPPPALKSTVGCPSFPVGTSPRPFLDQKNRQHAGRGRRARDVRRASIVARVPDS